MSEASIPNAGDVFRVVYPFVRTTYTEYGEDGPSERPSWRPGIDHRWVDPENTEPYADAEGQMRLAVVGTFKPGRFPMRVFYTRKFVDPDGHEFGKGRLHIATLEKFRRLARGYGAGIGIPYSVGKPERAPRFLTDYFGFAGMTASEMEGGPQSPHQEPTQ